MKVKSEREVAQSCLTLLHPKHGPGEASAGQKGGGKEVGDGVGGGFKIEGTYVHVDVQQKLT